MRVSLGVKPSLAGYGPDKSPGLNDKVGVVFNRALETCSNAQQFCKGSGAWGCKCHVRRAGLHSSVAGLARRG
jgi:hypothetical protein